MKNLLRLGILTIVVFIAFLLLKPGTQETNAFVQATLEETELSSLNAEKYEKHEVGMVSQTTEKGIQLRISSDKAV